MGKWRPVCHSERSEESRSPLFLPDSRHLPFILIGGFGPFLSAAIVIKANEGWRGLRQWLKEVFRLRVDFIWYLTGTFLLPIGVGVFHYGLYQCLGGQPDFSDAYPWYTYLLALLLTALVSGGNEEPGWRGFGLPGLLTRFPPVLATLILGIIHAAWHLPLMNHYGTSFAWYLFDVPALTFIFNWLYYKSRMSVLPVMLFHAGTNVIGSYIPTPSDVLPTLDSYMFVRGVVYWAIAAILLISTKGRLAVCRSNRVYCKETRFLNI